MKLFHYLPVGACAAAAALLPASCGVSKRSLKQSNRALTAALQASAQKEQAEALKLYSDTSIPQGEAFGMKIGLPYGTAVLFVFEGLRLLTLWERA